MKLSFQSTPSQRGRQNGKIYGDSYKYISIHALAKRATINNVKLKIGRGDFNPRPRKEGDLDAQVTISNNYFISIHALAKRATILKSPMS